MSDKLCGCRALYALHSTGASCDIEYCPLHAAASKLLEACQEGAETLKLALATIAGACGIPKERRKLSPTLALMEEAIAVAKEGR